MPYTLFPSSAVFNWGFTLEPLTELLKHFGSEDSDFIDME